jgi:dihydroneopterin aldolase
MNQLKNVLFQDINKKGMYRTIFLESVIRNMDIGVHEHEIGHLQRIEFNIYAAVNGNDKIINDNLEEVINYEYLVDTIDSKINKRFSLLETLADEILEDVLSPEKVMGATVIISKLDILDSGKIGCSVSRLK